MVRIAVLSSLFLSLGALGAIAACNPYDPDLGSQPFRCGTDDPRCPDGYHCVEYTPDNRICEKEGEDHTADAGPSDGRPFSCADDDQIEPNNTIQNATLANPDPEYSLAGLAICPAGDIDVFRFRTDADAPNIEVKVNYDSSQGQLILDIRNSSGVKIADGAADPTNPDLLVAHVANADAGAKYTQVQGANDQIQNNFSITITLGGP
jgi:hypothetical protein